MATTETTRESLEEWRATEFENMGFNTQQATALAVARDDEGWPISTHKVASMVENGCTTELAVQILL